MAGAKAYIRDLTLCYFLSVMAGGYVVLGSRADFHKWKDYTERKVWISPYTGPRQPVACFTQCSIYAHPQGQSGLLKTVMPVYLTPLLTLNCAPYTVYRDLKTFVQWWTIIVILEKKKKKLQNQKYFSGNFNGWSTINEALHTVTLM